MSSDQPIDPGGDPPPLQQPRPQGGQLGDSPLSGLSSVGGGGNYSESSDFVLFNKYEDVAMHFNELIIRLRTQAVGGLAGIVAISGFAVNFAQKSDSTQWPILFGSLVFFLVSWVALWILDSQYYNRLLEGAVKAIREHEQKTQRTDCPINLSTRISEAVPKRKWTVHIFYSLVAAGLFGGILYTGYQAFCAPTKAKVDAVEHKIQLSIPDAVKVISEPAKIEQKIQPSIPDAVKGISDPKKGP